MKHVSSWVTGITTELVSIYTRYNLVYYGSRYRNEDSGLGGDLSNARKPDQGASRRSAIKIIDYMLKSGYKTPLDLKNFLSDKWEKIAELDYAKTESIDESVGGNYLYHATSPAGLKGILQSGYIGAQQTAQPATDAQTKLPSVAVTRDWNYAAGSSRSSEGVGQGAVIVFDRNSIESKYKTFGTSQSSMIKGLPNTTADSPQMKKLAMQTKFKDANKNGKLDYDELPAGAGGAALKHNYFRPKSGGEAEEAVVVPKGKLPLQGSMVGFWVDTKSELMKDPTIVNDARRLELSRAGRFTKATPSVGESITEAFDQPYKILRWETSDYGNVDAIARLDDNTFLSIMFNKTNSARTGQEAWSVQFFRNNSQEVTGEGDAPRVFATVLGAIQTFIEKYKPKMVLFSATKEVEDGQKSQSRARLYDSLVQRYANSWGYRARRTESGSVVQYELTALERISEGGWASTETQDTVITPKTVAEIVETLKGFENSYNIWQSKNGYDAEIKMGNPKGSGTYYRRDLAQDPTREYGDIDVECFIHSRDGVKTAQRTTEYKRAITEYCLQSPDYSTENGTNIIMRTTDGPAQVDLLYTYHEHADWSRALSPEYRVKGVISTSLTSALAEVLNLSFSSQGIQVKIRNNQPVSFRQSRDTELRTVSINPNNWAKDIYSLYYYLAHGEKPTEFPGGLDVHSGLKDEQRLSDIVLSIKSLASALDKTNMLGHGALISIPTKQDLVRKVATVYSSKLETAENSSKFDKAQTPAAVEKAKKTKLMLAKYRNEITKLLLN